MRRARSAILAVLSCVVAPACEVGGPGTPYVIPGPTAPTAVTSGPPFHAFGFNRGVFEIARIELVP